MQGQSNNFNRNVILNMKVYVLFSTAKGKVTKVSKRNKNKIKLVLLNVSHFFQCIGFFCGILNFLSIYITF